jgi:hypothetical protein
MTVAALVASVEGAEVLHHFLRLLRQTVEGAEGDGSSDAPLLQAHKLSPPWT